MTGRVRSTIVSATALAVLLFAAYANHFHNGFHFDDDHTIVNNPYVRRLAFVPRYFVDATTFSVLPQNQSYRPLAQTTFAIDYAIGGDRPIVFQVDTFVWFLALLAATFALARALTGRDTQAMMAAAVFGLHPAVADTVSYIVQRGEIVAALGVVSGLALLVGVPASRRAGLYLVPVVAGMLAKQTAAVFPLLVAAYAWIYQRRAITRDVLISLVVTGATAAWITASTPASAAYNASPPMLYRLTQPFVALRYVSMFFAPVSLSADYDWTLVSGIGDPRLLVGVTFVLACIVAVWWLRRHPSTRAIAFGLAWFLIAQLPTALVPLSEVANNWRMLLPFIGLAIAVVAAVELLVVTVFVAHPLRAASVSGGLKASAALKGCATACLVVLLVGEAMATRARNDVWHDELSLWSDTAAKSPENARAWMNLGVALMARGDYPGAVDACERALVLAPQYTLVHVNLGVAYGEVGRAADAEREFLAAQHFAPDDWRTHVYYAEWLRRQGRVADAAAEERRARELNPVAMSNQQM